MGGWLAKPAGGVDCANRRLGEAARARDIPLVRVPRRSSNPAVGARWCPLNHNALSADNESRKALSLRIGWAVVEVVRAGLAEQGRARRRSASMALSLRFGGGGVVCAGRAKRGRTRGRAGSMPASPRFGGGGCGVNSNPARSLA